MAWVRPDRNESHLDGVEPGDGWAKNDSDIIGVWRSGLIRVDRNNELGRDGAEVVAMNGKPIASERDVATFLVKGCRISEIAALCGSAEGTTKSHLNAIYRSPALTIARNC